MKVITAKELKHGNRFSFIPVAWHGPSVVCSSYPSGDTWTLKYDNPKIINPPGVSYVKPDAKVRLLKPSVRR
jgi:hypothetical protein